METTADRQDWMGLLARAPEDALVEAAGALGPEPAHTWLRRPEIGTVMVRGRAGGTGAPFNLGEMTVTRCSLELGDGTVGHACVAGRSRDKARIAALCDALLQGARAGEVGSAVIEPLRQRETAAHAALAGRAEKTRVDFFTMVRGEN